MAELPPPPRPPGRPRPRPPPLPARVGNGARVWVPPRSNLNPIPLGPIIPGPAAGYGWMNPPLPPLGYGSYGPPPPGPCFFGLRPYGYGYPHNLRPALLLPHVNMKVNPFVENRSRVESHTRVFALCRRGTGVFHPQPRVTYHRPVKNSKGMRQKQGIRKVDTNNSKDNDGLVKQEEECHTPTSEIGLPKEWTY